MTHSSPEVSVVMAVHNGEAHLRAALDSVLGQTAAALELVVVDDGSDDGTPEILARAAQRDPRMALVTNEKNLGLTASLNRGIRTARAPIIARQDADDLSDVDRLSSQLSFLRARPEVGLLGTAYREVDSEGRTLVTRSPPTTDTQIRAQMLFHNALCHSSVVVRRRVLEAAALGPGIYYDESLPFGQDADLWGRLLHHTQAANLCRPLVSLRKHPASISALHGPDQQRVATAVALRQVRELAPELSISEEDMVRLRAWYAGLDPAAEPSGMALCGRYFDLLDLLARRPGSDHLALARQRRHHVEALLRSANLSQLAGLLRSGVLARMILGDPAVTLRVGLGRLRRRAASGLRRRRALP